MQKAMFKKFTVHPRKRWNPIVVVTKAVFTLPLLTQNSTVEMKY